MEVQLITKIETMGRSKQLFCGGADKAGKGETQAERTAVRYTS